MLFMGLVTPDAALAQAIGEQIKRLATWQLAVFSSPQEALEAWPDTLPPLIFWDIEAGNETPEARDLFTVRLRETQNAPWLIMLGAWPENHPEPEISEQLERPLRLGHLLSRLQFYERLLQQPPDTVFRLGPWEYRPRTRTLSAENGAESTRLTDKEAALLDTLILAHGPVSRDKLLEDVWGYSKQVDTHTLETHIYRLRRKLMGNNAQVTDCFAADQGGYQIHPSWRPA